MISSFIIFGVTAIIFIVGYSFLFRQIGIFGGTVRTRIIALAATSILYSAGVIAVFISPLRLVAGQLSILSLVTRGDDASSDNSAEVLRNMLTRTFTETNVQSLISALIALALWAVIGHLIDSFNRSSVSTTALVTARFRQNVILGIVFVLSVYMSFAAIIAVPYFMEEDTVVVESNKMRASLDSLRKINSYYYFKISSDLPALPDHSVFDDAAAPIQNKAYKARMEQILRRIGADYNANNTARQLAQMLLYTEKDNYARVTNRAYNEALNKYGEQETSLKSKLKIIYMNELARWYSKQSRLATIRAEEIKAQVQKGDDNLALAIRNFQSDFFKLATLMATDTSRISLEEKRTLIHSIDSVPYRTVMGNYYENFEIPTTAMMVSEELLPPDPPTPGQELGIFKPISQWLLTPRYMALVLIVGMLGFGLFGSAVSTFVRTNLDPDNDGIIDVTGVIVRGASAAIVIFLAVKGGISVFIQGDSELNPYSVFLTCLIGAVYSERVWVWAKEQLEGKLAASTPSPADTVTNATPTPGEVSR